ncbi:MAG: hypothetical protein ACSHYF_14520 [Verrucomicrobiaceae bacterium]
MERELEGVVIFVRIAQGDEWEDAAEAFDRGFADGDKKGGVFRERGTPDEGGKSKRLALVSGAA